MFNNNKYIKFFDKPNMFLNGKRIYKNSHIRLLIEEVAKSQGFIADQQIQYHRTKDFICKFIKKHYNLQDVSIKQISKLEKPRKNICSKYAPVYLIAIYTILLSRDLRGGAR